ncbi:MAG: PD-(D/E)XK nuclease-like domain-containing protein [Beijerinckiaceae bacterium]
MTIEQFPTTTPGNAAPGVVEKIAEARGKRSPFIARQWTGDKITEPGCYLMPIEAYHSDCCDGPSISSSGLRIIENLSPAHYWAASSMNPDREPQEPSDALILGRAAHHLLLGEGRFREQFSIRPDEFDSWRTKAAQAWRAAEIAAGKTVLIPQHIKIVRGMARSLAAHPLIQGGLLNGEIERSLIWKDKETGVWLKARPDAIPIDTDIVDLKTTADASGFGCRKAIESNGYHMQMALIGMGMEAIFGRKADEFHYTLVFVEKSPPFAVNVKPIDPNAIWWGRKQLRRAIRRFADCCASNDWPAYDDDTTTASLPDWYVRRLEMEAQSGLLPDDEDAAA